MNYKLRLLSWLCWLDCSYDNRGRLQNTFQTTYHTGVDGNCLYDYKYSSIASVMSFNKLMA